MRLQVLPAGSVRQIRPGAAVVVKYIPLSRRYRRRRHHRARCRQRQRRRRPRRQRDPVGAAGRERSRRREISAYRNRVRSVVDARPAIRGQHNPGQARRADSDRRPGSVAAIEVAAGAAGRREIARADAGQARSRSAEGRAANGAGNARASGGNRQASGCNRQSAAAHRRRGHSGRGRQHHTARSGRGRRALDRRAAGCRAEIGAGQRAEGYGRVRAHADPDRAVAIGHDVIDTGVLDIALIAGRAGAGSEGWAGGEQNCCGQRKRKPGEFRSRHHCF